ncbi:MULTISPECIES: gamma carbonic anhydrase family protein [Shewanella]|jgi:carbonic anhydrase/acetyltransferase-like protein (isoleucine patch superfamily)|uniref:Gamma carbonic anhydrase family protein n=1 Tax=Shewanella vesiculosa TaxID=518738 RepID=A0ABV0FTM7_9GAMM|nr:MULTISPECIES: gamma carbonic anhydrase family protein [Shewanella]NCQ47040.1 gamma carbonic anhydrase family protein [Shewanella frigidimarina]MBB1323476.1 gamma carbonic anhydrase family protein [Shewanella sp. SR43-8]NCO73346.1 gamma carbonic anhydrase family protein [Shewanella vesiculosa]NCP37997.1 gamma carbonic anhydrase family protein [Shewanella vesiculosa]NCP71146.1 gamma carbonic anhydrase family protein [Shewanella vesiculosa]|tara:strand:+ start:148 stop:693 length:546 start_codon:yes stop_codon:yes gene_type:complete
MSTNVRTYQGIHPNLADNVYVDESAVLVGDIKLDHDASVWPLVAARGDVNKIRIGKRSNVQDGSILHVTRKSPSNPEGNPLIIGDDVTIGHKAMLHGCKIGHRVLIGMGAILLDGAIVEDDVIVGAGSLVPPNKVLQSGYLYVGSPCKQVRPLTDAERAFLPMSADNYVRLKNEYLVDLQQ